MGHEISEKRWKGRVQRKLLQWFDKNERPFPWRRTTNPFRVLIAEKLLQQTAATPALIAAYQQTVRLFPTPAALARAPVRTLKAIIAPLGFHYRAGELKRLAKTLVSKHNGRVPEDFGDLIQLPGIGDYSARAVLAFAFGLDVPVVDTNVARFLHRIYGLDTPVGSNPARSRSLLQLATSLIPSGRARNFNLAVLDLCALICTSSRPNCTLCPLRSDCTFANSSVDVQNNARR